MARVALITGITGQDGSYLAELLIDKKYDVWGIIRRSSNINTTRIEHIFDQLTLRYGDLTDSSNIINLLSEISNKYPNLERLEIYNLAAMSHVKVSFEMPEYTCNVDAAGSLRLLEAIRSSNIPNDKIRFYQASTSELYGKVVEVPQSETTPFYPRSPYGVAKLYGYWITKNYREAYGMHASNGILFNHESPLRGETFVTRKITRAVAKISLGLQENIHLGNLDAQRDWGHAKDYVEGMWRMLQQSESDDYVLATGHTVTIRSFVNMAFAEVGIDLEWKGKGVEEIGIDKKTGKTLVAVDPRYFRPTEVELLVGDATKAKEKLGWTPTHTLEQLCSEMVASDIALFKRDKYLLDGGHDILNQHEA